MSAVRVVETLHDGPATRAGLRTGDIVIAFDDTPITGVDDLVRYLDGSRIGRPVLVTYIRNESVTTVATTPIEREREQ